MDKTLLLVVIALGLFSIFKIIMFITYSFMMKPKVDENGHFVKTPDNEKSRDEWDDDW